LWIGIQEIHIPYRCNGPQVTMGRFSGIALVYILKGNLVEEEVEFKIFPFTRLILLFLLMKGFKRIKAVGPNFPRGGGAQNPPFGGYGLFF